MLWNETFGYWRWWFGFDKNRGLRAANFIRLMTFKLFEKFFSFLLLSSFSFQFDWITLPNWYRFLWGVQFGTWNWMGLERRIFSRILSNFLRIFCSWNQIFNSFRRFFYGRCDISDGLVGTFYNCCWWSCFWCSFPLFFRYGLVATFMDIIGYFTDRFTLFRRTCGWNWILTDPS